MDIYLCARNEKEDAVLSQFCVRYFIQRNCDAEIHHILSAESFKLELEENACVSLFILDAESKGIRFAKEIQHCNSGNYIVLIGSEIRSVMACVSPKMRPAGILIKPIKKADLEIVFDEVWTDYQNSENRNEGEQFVFSAGGEKIILPIRRILYFEAAAKKVVVRTENQEFEFYGSMQKIAEGLPDCFLRVHRSYIVNMNRVENVSFAENTIALEGDCLVMMARNSREKVQEYLERKK